MSQTVGLPEGITGTSVNNGCLLPSTDQAQLRGFLSCTGDGALVTMMLVTSFFMCIITYSLNTPEP